MVWYSLTAAAWALLVEVMMRFWCQRSSALNFDPAAPQRHSCQIVFCRLGFPSILWATPAAPNGEETINSWLTAVIFGSSGFYMRGEAGALNATTNIQKQSEESGAKSSLWNCSFSSTGAASEKMFTRIQQHTWGTSLLSVWHQNRLWRPQLSAVQHKTETGSLNQELKSHEHNLDQLFTQTWGGGLHAPSVYTSSVRTHSIKPVPAFLADWIKTENLLNPNLNVKLHQCWATNPVPTPQRGKNWTCVNAQHLSGMRTKKARYHHSWRVLLRSLSWTTNESIFLKWTHLRNLFYFSPAEYLHTNIKLNNISDLIKSAHTECDVKKVYGHLQG